MSDENTTPVENTTDGASLGEPSPPTETTPAPEPVTTESVPVTEANPVDTVTAEPEQAASVTATTEPTEPVAPSEPEPVTLESYIRDYLTVKQHTKHGELIKRGTPDGYVPAEFEVRRHHCDVSVVADGADVGKPLLKFTPNGVDGDETVFMVTGNTLELVVKLEA